MTTPVRRAGISPTAADGWAVETHGLTKRFGDNVAVNGVELLVPRGSAFGYLGPNGAGKTTLIRVLLGLTHADAGTMSLLGRPVPRQRDEALARVGAIVDEPRFHAHLTGRQNLQVLAAAREPAASQRIEASLERVGILHRADDKVSTYSMGMRQRLGVAACLIGNPDLLILDEPMNGLDPAGMQDMRQMIGSLVAEGSGGRGGSHPPAPSDPGVTVSRHRALPISHQNPRAYFQWANRPGCRSSSPAHHRLNRVYVRSRRYFLAAQRLT
jgi:ABC-type Na+ transport system ATPase subunit NatA